MCAAQHAAVHSLTSVVASLLSDMPTSLYVCVVPGVSAVRTLHTAEDAAEGCEKWVFQLWLCPGLPRRPPINGAAAAARQMAEARKGTGSATKKQKRPNKKKR